MFYLTWFVSEEIKEENVGAFGEHVAAKLPGKTVELKLSVRDMRERGVGGKPFKVSVFAELGEAVVPVEVGGNPSYEDPCTYDSEYERLVEFFGGQKCLDVDLVEFHVLYSKEYFPFCDKLEDMNVDVWRIAIFSPRFGPVSYTEVFEQR
jgi:hypothetical protein